VIFVIQFHRLGLAREGDTGGGGVKKTFYAAARSPSLLPSELAGISSRKKKRKKAKKPKARKAQHVRDLHLFGKGVPEPRLVGLEPLLPLETRSRGTQRRPWEDTSEFPTPLPGFTREETETQEKSSTQSHA
jgi:hypothetical protein